MSFSPASLAFKFEWVNKIESYFFGFKPVLLASGSIDDKVEAILEPVEDETVQVQIWVVLATVHQYHKYKYKHKYKTQLLMKQ